MRISLQQFKIALKNFKKRVICNVLHFNKVRFVQLRKEDCF